MGVQSLKVRLREIVSADETRSLSICVYCPSRRQTIPMEECKGCARAQEVSPRGVVCTPVEESGKAVTAGMAATHHAVCVRGDVPGRLLVSLAAEEPWHLAVIDERDRFLGFVASRRLAGVPRGRTVLDQVPAYRLASGAALAIHESESLRDALRMMAHHGTRVLALLDDDGVYRGELNDLEALRALA